MTYNESIALIAAVAAVGYWLGRKQSSQATKATSAAPVDPYSMDWLGAWAQA
jgi:flagellar basal body-associated protein FliL